MTSLLLTKIQLPPLRQQYIQRPRLLARIEPGNVAPLVLISAPAGFGKSTALIQWAHSLTAQGGISAWYALDERDNDPARFAAYLLAALAQNDAAFAALADSPAEPEEAVNRILNAAAAHTHPVLLILDDYHLITTPQIHEAISLMAEYAPANLRLALGTRADPPLPLARLRARGAIIEIRMGDLRFTSDELRAWLHAVLGWSLSTAAVDALEKVTEGWAAALALILMTQPDADEAALLRQLTRYSQSQRHIFDYFSDEILNQQPDSVRRFLLDTCVLNRLEPALCQAMTGLSDAPLLLNQLAGATLFVIPLSDAEPVYRYHHLFAQFLCQYLELGDRARYLGQHRRAATWYADHGSIVEAVHHALAGEDYRHAADLITVRAWDALTARGEIMTIIHWLPHFPEDALRRHPRLCLYFSRALYLTGDLDQSHHYVRLALDVLAEDDERPERDALRAIACNYQATLDAYRGDVLEGRRWITEADTLKAAVAGVDRARIANTNAFLHYLMGDVPAARAAYVEALQQAEAIEHHYLMLDAHYYLAQVDLLAGELEAVCTRCEALLAAYPTPIGPLASVMLPLALVLHERNQLAEAEALLHEAIELARGAHIPDVLWSAHITLANVLLSRGDMAGVEASIGQAQRFAQGYHSPMMASFIGAASARLMLRAGQMAAAVEWAEGYRLYEPRAYHQDYEGITLASIWIAQGQSEQALTLLEQLIDGARAGGRFSYVIAAEALRARAWQMRNDLDMALGALRTALTLATPHRFVRLFLSAGEPMRRLLRLAVERVVAADYAAHLLEITAQVDDPRHPADSLTERELEVLAYIAAGASNQAIADALTLSVGTVKSHIHHIMDKLDAHNRTEAVSKARRLHLLDD